MQNRNSSTTQEVRDVSRSQDAVEALPSSFSPSIQLVAEVNPKALRRTTFAKNISGTSVPAIAGKQFYVTYIWITGSKAAADTGTQIRVFGVINGATVQLAGVISQTLTADSKEIACAFPSPIAMDENTAVTQSVTGTWTTTQIIVGGYYA